MHGTHDDALLPEYARAVYAAARGASAGGEKRLEWIETDNHVQLCDQEPYVRQAVGVVVSWLDEHMRASSD